MRATQARYNASEKGRAASARYNASEKGRATQARYWASEKGRANRARYASTEKSRAANRARQARYKASEKGRAAKASYWESHIRVTAAGRKWTHPVRPERKAEIIRLLADFREKQREEYRRETEQWPDQLDSRAK